MKRYIIYGSALLVVVAAITVLTIRSGGEDGDDASDRSITVERGDITRLALATGTIEPRNEIEVKSKISGVVSRIFVSEGDFVNEGEPIMEVRPDPTPLELAEAKRNLERSESEYENLSKELDRKQRLKERDLISEQEFDDLQQRHNDARISKQLNSERLQLLESGRVQMGDVLIESVIRAPSSGYLLEKNIDLGDPVIPLTTYQAGTPVATLANMDDLIFKGEVDEIDIGRVEEGQRVDLEIGALPDAELTGVVSKISLKAHTEDNKRVFPIEITLDPNEDTNLRAGYSANANIIIDERRDVKKIPERVISFRDDSSFVEIAGEKKGERIEKEIKVGLSDNVDIEVLEGLTEGEKVLEKPLRTVAGNN